MLSAARWEIEFLGHPTLTCDMGFTIFPDRELVVRNRIDPDEWLSASSDQHAVSTARDLFTDLGQLGLGFEDPDCFHDLNILVV